MGRSTTLDAVPSLPLDQSATAGSPDRFAQMPAPGTKNLAVEAVPAVQLDQAPSGAFVEWIGMGPGRAPLHQSTAAIPMAQQAPSAAMRDRVGQGALRPPSADPMSSAPSSGPVVPYYLARILPTPAEGAANAISVVGWGFLPNEVVSIWLDLDSAERARVLGAAEADANTIYRANALTIPPETLPGEHTLSAVGQTSGRLATALLFLEVAPAQ